MTETEIEAGDDASPKKKKSKLLLLAGVAALLAGGGGFAAVQAGLLDSVLAMIGIGGEQVTVVEAHGAGAGSHGAAQHVADASYVFVEPMVISLGPESRSKHLKVVVAIDVVPGREPDVTNHLPRVVDTLQGFLRAVDEREFEAPLSMERLRSQMLRRVVLVTPAGAARDLLIQEFVLN